MSGTPKRRSVKPSRAASVATRRSHHSASSRPPARHQPEIAAIVGLEAVRRVKPRGPSALSRRGPKRVERLEVGAGAEGGLAGSGEDEDAGAVVGLEGAEVLQQPLGGRAVHGVAPLGAVDRQDGRGADALEASGLAVRRHAGAPRATSRRARRRPAPAALCAALRRSLRFSRRHWTRLMKATKSGKKAMRMNPALVTTLSLASP